MTGFCSGDTAGALFGGDRFDDRLAAPSRRKRLFRHRDCGTQERPHLRFRERRCTFQPHEPVLFSAAEQDVVGIRQRGAVIERQCHALGGDGERDDRVARSPRRRISDREEVVAVVDLLDCRRELFAECGTRGADELRNFRIVACDERCEARARRLRGRGALRLAGRSSHRNSSISLRARGAATCGQYTAGLTSVRCDARLLASHTHIAWPTRPTPPHYRRRRLSRR